jgi:anaerobic selenocysteine-containing dehydrogenase
MQPSSRSIDSESSNSKWRSTACILCSLNCGLEVQVERGHLEKIRGDKKHPISHGYQCQKATRLDFYQNGRGRLTTPLRRRRDGSFEEITWQVAISEVASKLKHLRDSYGGFSMAYYGGGGQGNHLGGAHASTLRAAMGTRFIYSPLAQEKTGGFWVNGKMFGKQTCHPAEDVEHADFVLFIGTNPWQSHGFPRARTVLKEIAADSGRTMVVIDPRRTETAERADIFLQVRPGTDAFLMLAMLGTIVQEGLEDRAFLERRTTGWEELKPHLESIDVQAFAGRSGIDAESVRRVARGLATAERGCVRTDLGLEHSLHSTLNTFLSKLLFLVTGQFGKPGTVNLHSFLAPLIGHSPDPEAGGRRTRVTGMREISKLYPPNILPQEIVTDHPERIRGLVVDSSNPLMTAADSRAYREAFEKLEVLVVIDVAMTETAQLADYVLPAPTQFEKWEATFFNFEFPSNFFHLRRPVLERHANTLSEPEIYHGIAAAMGKLPKSFPFLRAVARLDRFVPRARLFPMALKATLAVRPKLKQYLPTVLHETLGAALPGDARSAAVVWGACQYYARKHADAVRRAGIEDRCAGLGDALFERILDSPSGAVISTHSADEMWSWIRHDGGKIRLVIPEMIAEMNELKTEQSADLDFPFILLAGERRAFNANTIIRDQEWRRRDPEGVLKLNPADAESIGLEDGQAALCESSRGAAEVRVLITDELQPGVVSMPHGYGIVDEDLRCGPAVNELTSSKHCDDLAKTPFHKFVPVRIRPLQAEVESRAEAMA